MTTIPSTDKKSKVKMPTIILTNRVLIPIKLIEQDLIVKNYDKWIYDQKSCQRCEYKHERHSEFCTPCEAFKGHFVQYKKIVRNGKTYWSLPRAELYRLKDLGVKRYKVLNKMTKGSKLDTRILVTKTPYDYQKKSIKELVIGDGRENYFPHGILKAAPRSGKCVVGSTLITTEFGLHPIQDLFDAHHVDGEVREVTGIKINSIAGTEWKTTKDSDAPVEVQIQEVVTHLYKKVVDQTIEIQTTSGISVRGTPEHPVLVRIEDDGTAHEWRRLDELREYNFVCLKIGSTVEPIAAPEIIIETSINLPTHLNSGIAKLMGYAVGIGVFSKKDFNFLIAESDDKTRVRLLKILEALNLLQYYNSKLNCLVSFAKVMSNFGILADKKLQPIPKIILSAPLQLQKDFLEAFVEAVGTNTTKNSFKVLINSVVLVKQLQVMFLGLGIVAKYTKSARYNFTIHQLTLDFDTVLDTTKFVYERIESIKVFNEPITVYDVTVPGTHSFIGNGLVVHNTLMSLVSAIKLKRKTLILANQEDLLKQFIIELKDSTNIEDIDKFDGRVSFGMCSKVEEFEKYDICLATYQTFISKQGKEKLKKVRKLFGTVFVDEAHRCAANAFSQVIDSFYAENRFGLTATETRKDKLDFITQQILGPVVTEASVKSLIPRVVVIPTSIAPKHNYKTWNGAMQFLANNKERTDLIMEWIKKDLKAGRKIVIPVMYKKQVQELVDRVRKLGYTSEAFIGGMKREELLEKARAGKIDVVVGIRSILATGVNVPIWDSIYTISPISNPPNYYQETTRICTPLEGKPEPIIRLFVDDIPMTKGCFRTCWTQTILPMKYIVTDKTKEKAKAILSTMRGGYREDSFDEGTDSDGKVYRDASLFDLSGNSAKSKKTKTISTVKVSKIQTIGLFKR